MYPPIAHPDIHTLYLTQLHQDTGTPGHRTYEKYTGTPGGKILKRSYTGIPGHQAGGPCWAFMFWGPGKTEESKMNREL